MKISRITFVILLILFIFILAILSLILIAGMLLNRASNELTFTSSNVAYTQWQLPDGAKTRLGKGTIHDIKFSADGTRFYVATTIGIWEYDTKTGNEISLIEGDRNNIIHIAFSPDGNTLKGINRSNHIVNVMQWNIINGELISSIQDIGNIQDIGKRKVIYTSDFSANGMRFAGVGLRKDKEINLWTITDDIFPPRYTTINLSSKKIGRAIALSSDGRYLATTMTEKANHPIHIWNVDTGERLNTFAGNKKRIVNMAFSSDGTILASGDINETITLWRTNSDTSNVIYKGTYSTSLMFTFSPDGELLASGDDDGKVRLFKVNGNENENEIGRLIKKSQSNLTNRGHKAKVTSLAFSPDGKILISGSEDGTVRGSDVISRNQLFVIPGHTVEIYGLAELTEENNLMTMHWPEGQLLRWDIRTGHQLSGTYFFGKSPEALSHDGKTLLIEDWFTFSKNKFKLWSIPKRKIQAVLKGDDYELSTAPPAFVFSPDGKMLASTDFYTPNGDIQLWDIDNPHRSFFQTIFFRPKSINLTRTLSAHTDRVLSMVFSPNGQMLASNDHDKKLCLWNVQTGKNIFTHSDYRVFGSALVFSNDGKILASGSYNRIALWDPTTGQQLKKTQTDETVDILQFSPDNKILLSGTHNNGKIQLFDAQSLQLLSTHAGHANDISALLFLADGKTLVSASEDGTMLLWDWYKIAQGSNSKRN